MRGYHGLDALGVELCLLGPVGGELLPLGHLVEAADSLLYLVACHLLVAHAKLGLQDGAPGLLAAAGPHGRPQACHPHHGYIQALAAWAGLM